MLPFLTHPIVTRSAVIIGSTALAVGTAALTQIGIARAFKNAGQASVAPPAPRSLSDQISSLQIQVADAARRPGETIEATLARSEVRAAMHIINDAISAKTAQVATPAPAIAA